MKIDPPQRIVNWIFPRYNYNNHVTKLKVPPSAGTKPILILSGPVSAGKSTVAREFIASAPGPASYIEGDTFWKFIAKGAESRGMIKNFKMVMTAMTAAAVPYALSGYEVVLDFSIPPRFLDTAGKLAKLRDVPVYYVVLCPSEKVCAARAASRSEGKIEDYQPYHDLYVSFEEAEKFMIRDDESGTVKLASQIREGLNAGRFRVQ